MKCSWKQVKNIVRVKDIFKIRGRNHPMNQLLSLWRIRGLRNLLTPFSPVPFRALNKALCRKYHKAFLRAKLYIILLSYDLLSLNLLPINNSKCMNYAVHLNATDKQVRTMKYWLCVCCITSLVIRQQKVIVNGHLIKSDLKTLSCKHLYTNSLEISRLTVDKVWGIFHSINSHPSTGPRLNLSQPQLLLLRPLGGLMQTSWLKIT